MWEWWIAGILGFFFVSCLVGYLASRTRRPSKAERAAEEYRRARRDFHHQRERLEAKFLELAGLSGKPRGLRWKDCDFADGVAYARDRQTGELCAFVGVTISFEAIEGGGMEEVEAVSNLRAATAVFRRAGEQWKTDGRAIFNLDPVQAIAHFQDTLMLVGEE
jgi:hypothetical protein